jgi:hypothetical protein
MLITKRELKKIIKESANLIRENSGAPCPYSTANQLHAAGYTQQEVDQFVDTLLSQYQGNRQQQHSSSPQSHMTMPNRGGLVGGLGFGGF